jgi:hypothetical protein
MSDVIERLKKRIEARKWKITDDAFVPELIGMQYANNMNDWCLEIIDEELAKEPQECNSDLISKLAEDFYYIENGKIHPYTGNYGETDYDESVDLIECINNQPQVQPIVKTPEEVVEMLNKISCTDCDRHFSHCNFDEANCKSYWIDWLTKKEV